MKKIGLLHHPKLPESQTLAKEIAHWLEAQGVTPWLGSAWDEEEVRRHHPAGRAHVGPARGAHLEHQTGSP